MCPYGNAAIHGSADRANAAQELQREPSAKDHDRWNPNHKNKQETQDPVPWLQDNVRTHHSGDCPAGAQSGEAGVEVERDMHQSGTHAADQVEEQIPQMAETGFHVVAKDPQEQHVAENMRKASVQEHAR